MPDQREQALPGRPESGLDAIRDWVFDLDNTLYPVTERLLGDIDRHITRFIADFLHMDETAARILQKDYFREYGLTLRGLMINHGLDPARYFDHMERSDLVDVDPDPALAGAIAGLRGRKFVYTNSSAGHTAMVLERLGMESTFDGVFDITAADYVPKPAIESYRSLCRRFQIEPTSAIMIDDIVRNLAPAATLGMKTVWMKTGAEWARDDEPDEHVHFVTDDLHAWLEQVAPA